MAQGKAGGWIDLSCDGLDHRVKPGEDVSN